MDTNISKEMIVLGWLNNRSGTVDEFVRSRRVYVNSWAPSFTHLFQKELIAPTGAIRKTQYGGNANVWRITQSGRELLDGKDH